MTRSPLLWLALFPQWPKSYSYRCLCPEVYSLPTLSSSSFRSDTEVFVPLGVDFYAGWRTKTQLRSSTCVYVQFSQQHQSKKLSFFPMCFFVQNHVAVVVWISIWVFWSTLIFVSVPCCFCYYDCAIQLEVEYDEPLGGILIVQDCLDCMRLFLSLAFYWDFADSKDYCR